MSSGEITLQSNNNDKIQSYSVGEIRNLSLADFDETSKTGANSVQMEKNGTTASIGAGNTDYEARPAYNEKEARPAYDQSEASSVTEEDLEAKPQTILVQSRDFENTSTFNFTDSLNDTRQGTLRGQVFDTLRELEMGALEEQRIEDAIRGYGQNTRDEYLRGSNDLHDNHQDGDKVPTRITLMMPSVADEDSSEEFYLEGDEMNSHEEDEGTFSD